MASGIPGNMNLPKLHTNHGAKSVQIAAPGVQESKPQGDEFKLSQSDMMSGTSMAPFAGGLVAHMLTANPDLTPQDIKTILLETAKDGQLDTKAALQASINHAPALLSMEEVSGVGLINNSLNSDQGLGLTGLNSLASVVASGRFEGLGGAYNDKQMAKR